MSQSPETAVLAEAGLRTVKELRSVILAAGIEAHIVRPPSARNTWGTKYWLAVASKDAEGALRALRDRWYAEASDEERVAAEAVIDHNAAEVSCPACGARFAPGTPECPDCGLAVM